MSWLGGDISVLFSSSSSSDKYRNVQGFPIYLINHWVFDTKL